MGRSRRPILRQIGRAAAALSLGAGIGGSAGLLFAATQTPGIAGAATQRGTLIVGNLGTGGLTQVSHLSIFAAPANGDPAPLANVTPAVPTGISAPFFLATDATGDVWVSNYHAGNITEYAPGQIQSGGSPVPMVTITSSALAGPDGLTFDAKGNLWVVDYGHPPNGLDMQLIEFSATQLLTGGTLTPTVVIAGANTGFDYPETSAFAANGDLWVANAFGDDLEAFNPDQLAGSGDPRPVITIDAEHGSLKGPYDLVFDPSGNLWVSNVTSNAIVSYTPAQLAAGGSPAPAVTLSSDSARSLDNPWQFTFDGAGDLWVANNDGPTTTALGSLSEFSLAQVEAGGSPTPVASVSGPTTGLHHPIGLLYVPPAPNYLMVAADGGTFAFGAPYEGSLPALGVHVDDIVGVVATADGKGYLMFGADGGTFAFGDATYEGSLPQLGVSVDDIVAVIPTPDDKGYLLIGRDGGVFAFGDAVEEGSLPTLGVHVDDIVGAIPTADGKGYLLIGSDGGTFAFGDANFEGSLPGIGDVGVTDIVGAVPTADDRGYLMIGSDGGTFAFGDANFEGSLPGVGVTVDNIVSVVPTIDDKGYYMIGSDGGTFAFGDATYVGSLPGDDVSVDNIVSAIAT